ncbi:protein phosphatase inhibitor 2-like [Selaginella moellendorffii]|uniref:protein phosphatase inhibitor 2-like n=1 Tax=Selaginella moellendorffii TaxID=88036 RepID=UPI000D1C97DC|nr:protein phosphatase inhibitor 2-like [Selaginella moellendorffii]XP_024536002.1 protein phosphatase inhibitor 2-like [Selaginella moellendorffii]|eukprot:XP_024517040.1 protein phosphatase inhibitor 2-like [Selaginella moellendorffii]
MKRGNSHSRARVAWDENNLDYLETHKTPKQKIDEPKTPFHAPGDLSPIPDDSKTSVDPNVLRHALENVASSSSDHGSSSSASNGKSRRKSFEDVRREHYSEFKTSKMLLQNVKDEEDLDLDRNQLAGGVSGIRIEENSQGSSKSS